MLISEPLISTYWNFRYMKTTKASWLQAVRQSHAARVYGRDSRRYPTKFNSGRDIPTANHVKGCIGVLITEDSSFHWRTKPRHL